MKKILALTLVCLLTLAFTMGVYAADAPSGSSSPVNVTIAVDEIPNYDLSFDWDTFDFTYQITKTFTPKTDTETAYYSETGLWYVGDETENGAEAQTATVTVTNNSNAQVKVSISYDETAPIQGVETDFEGVTNKTLANAADTEDTNPLSVYATFEISGDPTSAVATANVVIGTVTVSVVAA